MAEGRKRKRKTRCEGEGHGREMVRKRGVVERQWRRERKRQNRLRWLKKVMVEKWEGK